MFQTAKVKAEARIEYLRAGGGKFFKLTHFWFNVSFEC